MQWGALSLPCMYCGGAEGVFCFSLEDLALDIAGTYTFQMSFSGEGVSPVNATLQVHPGSAHRASVQWNATTLATIRKVCTSVPVLEEVSVVWGFLPPPPFPVCSVHCEEIVYSLLLHGPPGRRYSHQDLGPGSDLLCRGILMCRDRKVRTRGKVRMKMLTSFGFLWGMSFPHYW